METVIGKKMSSYLLFADLLRLHFIRINNLSEEIGLYPGQIRLILKLSELEESPSQREISEILNIAPPTLNVMVKSLEKNGFVYKKDDEKDQRIKRLYLTDAGTGKIKDCEKLGKLISEEMFFDFDNKQLDEVEILFGKMQMNLR